MSYICWAVLLIASLQLLRASTFTTLSGEDVDGLVRSTYGPVDGGNAFIPAEYGNGIAPENSYLTVDIQALPAPPIDPIRYAAWCFDSQTDIDPGGPGFPNYPLHDGTLYAARLYSSLDPNLNSFLAAHPNVMQPQTVWNEINWLVNHRRDQFDCGSGPVTPTMWEVQLAIFQIFGATVQMVQNLPPSRPDVVSCVVATANSHTTFAPKCGDKVAVIFDIDLNFDTDPKDDVQLIFMEVPYCPPCSLTVNVPNVYACRDGTASLQAFPSGGTAPYSYFWDGSSVASSDTLSPASSGEHTVVVTDSSGIPNCSATGKGSAIFDTLNVTVAPVSSCLAPATLTAVVTGGSGTITYMWDNLNDAAHTAATLSVSDTASHTVLVSDTFGAGCTATASAAATFDNLGVTVAPVSSCSMPATLTAVVTGGSGIVTYKWDNLTDAAHTAATLSVSDTAVHTVIVKDHFGSGCTATASAAATFDNLGVTVTPVSSCSMPATLTAVVTGGSGIVTYKWDNLTDAAHTAATLSVSDTAVHTVVVKDGFGNGCTAMASAKATFDNLKVTVADVTACPGSPATLTAVVTGGSGIVTYKWDNLTDAAHTAATLSVSDTAVHTVVVKDGFGNGCTATASGKVVLSSPYCDPSTVSFGGTGGTKSSYSFTADDGVTVKVTAFARNKSSGVWSSALVGQYSPGLGVTSPGEDGSSPNHTLDNVGSNGGKDNNHEYLLFEFSAPVTVTQAYLGWVYNDSDMTLWIGDLPAPSALSDSVLAGLTKEDNTTTSGSPRWAAFNTSLKTGKAIVIAAQPGDTTPDDYFKVSILKFCKPSCTPPAPVTANCVSVTAVKGTPITPVTMVGAGGCGGPYTFSAVGLPNNLVMSSSGTISGTPSVTGTYNYTVTITDNCGKTGTANCSVCVTAPPPPPQTCTTTTTFDFTGGNSPLKGYAGNILPFSGGGVNVKVSAFARSRTSGAWVTAYLGDYSHGLGVTDVNGEKEDGNNNTHTVDNVGGWDNYVLFEFSQVVTIDSMYLGYVVGDSDLTLKIGTFTDPYNNHLVTSQLNGFGYTEDNNTTSSSPRTAVVNQGSPRISGNAIMVAASLSDMTPDDYFKISTLNICSPSGTTPPPPWKDCDFGTCKNGSCTYKNSCHTVCGSGDDIWNNSDSCHFEWQPAGGDCTIIARCTGVGNTDPWAKAGVMIRETLNGDSKHVSCFVTPGNGCAFQYRSTTGGSSSNSNQTGINASCWLKMVRSGNTFTGYRSNDGWNWTQCGQVNVSMGTSCYIGLAVTSHNSGAVCTATFDNVTANP